MSDPLARHGPSILQHLSCDAPLTETAPGPACPPCLLRIIRCAVHKTAEDGPPSAAPGLPTKDSIMIDPDYRLLEEALRDAMKMVDEGLNAGRHAAELLAEISDFVIEHARHIVMGRAGMMQSLFSGSGHELDIGLGAVGHLTAEYLAASLVNRGMSANGAASTGTPRLVDEPAKLMCDALASAEMAAPLAVKIVCGIADAPGGYASTLGAVEKGKAEIAIVIAVARAVAACKHAAFPGPWPPCGPGRRDRGGGLSDCICREIAGQLAGPPAGTSGRS